MKGQIPFRGWCSGTSRDSTHLGCAQGCNGDSASSSTAVARSRLVWSASSPTFSRTDLKRREPIWGVIRDTIAVEDLHDAQVVPLKIAGQLPEV